MNNGLLESYKRLFAFYKELGEGTFKQLTDEQLFFKYNEESNSIAMIVKHLWGNMRSRWTDFLDSDGEKEWRNRDTEFEDDITTKESMMEKWNEGWEVLFRTLDSLKEEDLQATVYIRNQAHSVYDAIQRQLAHYPYHIGQIVYIGKMLSSEWHSLSIPKGASQQFNTAKFEQEKNNQHFTDEFVKKPSQ